MRTDETPTGGWEFVAEREGAARLLGALADLDDGTAYTKTEIAERTGVARKTLYLNDLVAECADLGLLAPVDPDGAEDDAADGETQYRVVSDSDLLAAAAAFDDAYRSQRADD
jgi:hypothetical protein